jgi:transglutaminase-like putative cysteine protease
MVVDHGKGDSWIAVALRMVVAALAGVSATWQAATFAGMAAAAIGAASGVLAGELLGRSKVRLPMAVGLGVALLLLGSAGWALLTRWEWVASWLGPGRVVALGDATLMVGLGLGICLILRALAARWRPAMALELAVMAAALATPLAAHRGGSINRPLSLGDQAWAAGEDPVVYLQLAGGAAAIGLALFLIAEKRWLRAMVAAVLILLTVAAVGLLGAVIQPPQLHASQGLGLTGQGKNGQGGKNGRRSLDQMDFRDNYGNKQRSAPVAVALLHDDYDPPSGVYYFRGNAFSRYNGKRMVTAMVQGAEADLFETFPVQEEKPSWVPPGSRRRYIKTTMGMLQDHVIPLVLESPASFSPAQNPSPRRFRRVYNATSFALDIELFELLGAEVGDPEWSPELRALYTEPPTDPRYQELAKRIVSMLPAELANDQVAQAMAITTDLGRRGTYSLRSRHAEADDPTASFLFGDDGEGDLTGYCVYFAHAAVFLMRAQGIPSRVATGYAYPASERGRGSAIMLRGSDAHAWPEVFVRDIGWVVMDVTPARNLESAGAPLDDDLQRLLGEMLRGMLDEQRQATLALGRSPVGLREAYRALGALARGVGVALMLLLVLLYVGKLYRRLIPAVAGPGQQTRLRYRLALDRLSEVGRRRGFGEPPEVFAGRVEELAPSLRPLARAAVALKLGSRKPDDPETARELSRQVRAELRGRVPWWRRVLGLLDPTTWVRVR